MGASSMDARVHVRKPVNIDGVWKVNISESISPTSKIIESFEANNYVNAFEIYRQIMKSLGRNL